MECAASPGQFNLVAAMASELVPSIGSGSASNLAEVMADWIACWRSFHPMQSGILLGSFTLRDKGHSDPQSPY